MPVDLEELRRLIAENQAASGYPQPFDVERFRSELAQIDPIRSRSTSTFYGNYGGSPTQPQAPSGLTPEQRQAFAQAVANLPREEPPQEVLPPEDTSGFLGQALTNALKPFIAPQVAIAAGISPWTGGNVPEGQSKLGAGVERAGDALYRLLAAKSLGQEFSSQTLMFDPENRGGVQGAPSSDFIAEHPILASTLGTIADIGLPSIPVGKAAKLLSAGRKAAARALPESLPKVAARAGAEEIPKVAAQVPPTIERSPVVVAKPVPEVPVPKPEIPVVQEPMTPPAPVPDNPLAGITGKPVEALSKDELELARLQAKVKLLDAASERASKAPVGPPTPEELQKLATKKRGVVPEVQPAPAAAPTSSPWAGHPKYEELMAYAKKASPGKDPSTYEKAIVKFLQEQGERPLNEGVLRTAGEAGVQVQPPKQVGRRLRPASTPVPKPEVVPQVQETPLLAPKPEVPPQVTEVAPTKPARTATSPLHIAQGGQELQVGDDVFGRHLKGKFEVAELLDDGRVKLRNKKTGKMMQQPKLARNLELLESYEEVPRGIAETGGLVEEGVGKTTPEYFSKEGESLKVGDTVLHKALPGDYVIKRFTKDGRAYLQQLLPSGDPGRVLSVPKIPKHLSLAERTFSEPRQSLTSTLPKAQKKVTNILAPKEGPVKELYADAIEKGAPEKEAVASIINRLKSKFNLSGLEAEDLRRYPYDRPPLLDLYDKARMEGLTHEEAYARVKPTSGSAYSPPVPTEEVARPSRSAEFNKIVEKIDTQGEGPLTRAAEAVGKKVEGIKKIPSTLETHFIDRYTRIEKATEELSKGVELSIENHPYKLLRLLSGVGEKASAYLKKGKYLNYTLGKLETHESFDGILKPYIDRPNDVQDLRVYMVARRTADYASRGGTTGVDPEAALRVVSELETKNPLVKTTFAKLQAFRSRLLDYLESAEVINKETKEAILAANPNAAPLHRVFKETGEYLRGAGGVEGARRPLHEAVGSTRAIVDPLESIIKDTYHLMSVADRNRVMVTFYKAWSQAPEEVARKFARDPAVKGLSAEGAGTPEVISFMLKGKKKTLRVTPGLSEAFSVASDEPSADLLTKLLILPKRALQVGATLDPTFAFGSNLPRDIVTSFIQSKAGIKPVIDHVGAIADILKKGDLYQEWKAGGGGQSTFFELERKYLNKNLRSILTSKSLLEKAGSRILHPLQTLEDIGRFSEELSKFAEFKKGMQGKDITDLREVLEKAYRSRNITTDFSRKGVTGGKYNRIDAFFNATIQGNVNVVKSLREQPMRTSLRAASIITLPTIALYLVNRNNPHYQELPRWRKDLFFNIPIGENKWITIPKPFTYGILFGTIPERFMEYIDSKDKHAFDGLTKQLYSAGVPALLPNGLTALVELLSNRSFFTGRPIIPRNLTDVTPEKQVTTRSSFAAKTISSPINALVREYPELSQHLGVKGLSPIQVDHLIRSWTGGLGSYASRGIDTAASAVGLQKGQPERPTQDVPTILRKFVTTGGNQYKSVEEYFSLLDKAEEAHKTVLSLRKTGGGDNSEEREYRQDHKKDLVLYNVLHARQPVVYNILRQIHNIDQDRDMKADEKKNKIDDLNKRLLVISQGALRSAKLTEKRLGS